MGQSTSTEKDHDHHNHDIESHSENVDNHPYPVILGGSELQWAFIRKVYAIVAMQLLLTVAVAAAVIFYRPIPHFFAKTTPGLIAYIAIVVLTLLLMLPLYCFQNYYPLNFLLLALFTISIAFSVGLGSAYMKGKVILEAAILCSIVVVSLTLYTFWAVKRGSDFSFLGPFLFSSLLVLVVFALIQILFPLGKLTLMIYSGFASIIFCGYIIYDTYNLIGRLTYDDYIWAAVAIYLDIINLFINLLNLINSCEFD